MKAKDPVGQKRLRMVAIGDMKEKLKKIKTSIKRFLRLFQVDWVDSFRINIKLPIRQFIKFPILVYRCKIDCLKGSVIIDSPKVSFGMIRLGLKTSGMCGRNNEINLYILGGVKFKGPGYMGNNSVIEVGKDGLLELGCNFGITGGIKIASRKHISIGDNFSSSWDVGVYDTDFHTLVNPTTGQANTPDKEIILGDDVWLCQRAVVLKGTHLPNRSIVACGAIINRDYSNETNNTIYAGCPAKPVKRDVTRKEFYDFETNPMINIVEYLHL